MTATRSGSPNKPPAKTRRLIIPIPSVDLSIGCLHLVSLGNLKVRFGTTAPQPATHSMQRLNTSVRFQSLKPPVFLLNSKSAYRVVRQQAHGRVNRNHRARGPSRPKIRQREGRRKGSLSELRRIVGRKKLQNKRTLTRCLIKAYLFGL